MYVQQSYRWLLCLGALQNSWLIVPVTGEASVVAFSFLTLELNLVGSSRLWYVITLTAYSI